MNYSEFNIIITEKPGMASKIACALCPERNCDMSNCTRYNINYFAHHHPRVSKIDHPVKELRCRINLLNEKNIPEYIKNNTNRLKNAAFIFSNKIDKTRYTSFEKSIDNILSDWNPEWGPLPFKEKVDWYYIKDGYANKNWIVLHTAGNPQKLTLPGKIPTDIDKPICGHNLLKNLYYKPGHNKHKSVKCRLSLISYYMKALSEKIGSIYIATDPDIAGSYIPTTLPGFKNIHHSKIKRIAINKVIDNEIRNAIDKAGTFDWNNAEAGKTRAYIDFFVDHFLQKALQKTIKNLKITTRISTGRTQFLAMDLIYRRWLQSRSFKDSGEVYIIFMGHGDEKSILSSLNKKAFGAVLFETRRGPYSQSGLLLELCKHEIGTAATRYKIIDKLINKELVVKKGEWIIPTEKGLAYMDYLLPLFQNQEFSLWDWNRKINKLLDKASTKTQIPKHELEQESLKFLYEFINEFLKAVRKNERNLSLFLEKIAGDIKIQSQESIKKTTEKKSNISSIIKALEKILDLEEIKGYIDVDNNELKLSENLVIERKIPEEIFDWEGSLRRITGMEREVAFRFMDGFQLENLVFLPEEMLTVFKANLSIDKAGIFFNKLRSGINKPKNLESLNISQPEVNENIKGAHEPLGLFDIKPEDIPGPDGFRLAAEYMRPYRFTVDLFKAQTEGKKLLRGFEINSVNFKRVMPFEYGIIHTFDTVLASMYERYKMSFGDTADLAEQLYLS